MEEKVGLKHGSHMDFQLVCVMGKEGSWVNESGDPKPDTLIQGLSGQT